LVVRRPVIAGCRDIPVQAAAAGNPDPIPDPMAPNPMDNPAPMIADAVTRDVELKLENSRIIAMTRAKIEADSAIACPTSMVLNKSPAP